MRGTVYAIKNKQTNQFYIGKTYKTIEERFSIHVRDSKKERNKNRKLYQAMNEFSIDSFTIFAIGEYEEGELELKEMYYIHLYESFKNGYNSTLGGDGRRYLTFSDEEIMKLYKEFGTAKKVANHLGICDETVRTVLKNHNVDLSKSRKRPVMIVETGEVFDSVVECAEHLISTGKSKSNKVYGVRGCIARVLRGERQSFLNHTFSFV